MKKEQDIREQKRYIKRRKRLIKLTLLALLIILTAIIVILTGQAVSRAIDHKPYPTTDQTSGTENITIQTDVPEDSYSTSNFTEIEKNDIDPVDLLEYTREDILDQLLRLAADNDQIADIMDNADEYPDDLLRLLLSNMETLDFVLHYPDRKDIVADIYLNESEVNGDIPLFLQWDERWGYAKYGNNIIALAGCGPTCLSMVIVGLTGNTSANPREVAQFSETNGYCTEDNNTDWGLMTTGALAYGLEAKELPLWESSIVQEIQSGHPVICCMWPGDFTATGHFIVIYGYDDGYFLVHDPNSMERSGKKWTYSTLESQIRNIWSYYISGT
jgi:hypothetical protein